MNTRPPPHDAAAALRQAQLRLWRVATAAEALGLPPRLLLHAGPPLRDPARPPAPLHRAVLAAALHAGWAAGDAEAAAMLADGRLQLQPAQTWGCVTPLAAVVSACTPLFGVCDGDDTSTSCWAPVSTVGGPDLRFGRRDAGLPARLADRDARVAPALAAWLRQRGPLPLWPLATAGLVQGDDLHSRTTAATAALVDMLGIEPGLLAGIAANPLYFLTIWMAACACLLRRLDGGDRPHWVCRAGGNGEVFGIALAGDPARWHCVDATAPAGPRLPGAAADGPVLPAIGDSAVIDMAGFGGQRLALAPEPSAVLGPWSGLDPARKAADLLAVAQPQLPDHWPVGVDAAQVVARAQPPLVALAMVADDPGAEGGGLVGRGIYMPPLALFAAAMGATRVR